MKKKLFIFLFGLLAASAGWSQKAVDWQFLSKVRWHKGYVASLNGYFDLPKFAPEIANLNKKSITIRGFYVPIDMDGTMFALSATPSNQCFFCDGGGIETVMEINIKKGNNQFKRIAVDKYIELKGILHINTDDSEHLMYVLREAELVSIIK
ncbi:hypothetical protein [Parabacteroides sp. Marseille-P3160]|uniref:hypothetical protein n=1 Tax=Parabacteroides sp. Marseille-P3160 TaxID=1917887 RepID=UPI0009BABDEE|nr:hypothetical protein [Parabacteroides sp. Marseille-P3160]